MDPNNLYLTWLVGLVDDGRAYQYTSVFHAAWEMEFTYSISLDANRAQDGIDLRRVYERDASVVLPELGPCRVLEFLIGLSFRMEHILYNWEFPNQVDRWFWELMHNLRLIDLGLHNTEEQNYEIASHVLQKVVDRDYTPAGLGGVFPIQSPENDQRDVEVWYQMHNWIRENPTRLA